MARNTDPTFSPPLLRHDLLIEGARLRASDGRHGASVLQSQPPIPPPGPPRQPAAS